MMAADRETARTIAAWTREMPGYHYTLECLEVALQFPDEDWDWQDLTLTNPEPDTVRAHSDLPWNWAHLSHDRYIDLLFEFPGKPWNWDKICEMFWISKHCENELLTTDFVIEHIDKPWRWLKMSRYCSIRIDFFRIIELFPDTPVSWKGLSNNGYVTEAILLKYADKPWNFEALSFNRALTLDMIRAFPRGDWDWGYVSWRASISLDQMLANRDLPWDWAKVSRRVNVTYEDAVMLPEIPWVWSEFAQKPGGVASFIEHRRRNRAARCIQAQWRRCVSVPSYLVCQRRLRREFQEW